LKPQFYKSVKNLDTKQWLEKPIKRTPREKSEEREALEQGTRRLEKVKVEGPINSWLHYYIQGIGVESFSTLQ
jgi:hypothetical protein